MEKFTKLEGVAAPVKMINVDTDMIVPADYLKTLKRTGLAKGLFSRIRRLADGNLDPEFALNKPAYKDAKILVAGDNFGCGSSREHAPWALGEYGFRAIIAPSYGDIFFNNSLKNGLLPIVLDESKVDRLFSEAAPFPGYSLEINLEAQVVIKPDGSGERVLTEGFHNEGPTWAPNGLFLMFFRESGGGGGPKIYMVDVFGRSETLVPTPGFASDPAWGPLQD